MKRSTLALVTLLAGAALIFAGCDNGSTDGSDTTSSTTDTTSGTTDTTSGTTDTTSGTTSGTTTTTTVEYATSVTSATMQDNISSGNNYQAVIAWLDTAKGYTPTTGDTLVIHLVGTSDATVDDFKAFVVDNTKAASWWTTLSGYSDSKVGTSGTTNAFDVTFEIALTGTASACDAAACKLGLYMDSTNGHEANLTFTTFSVTKK
jgi:hypothetical protein